MVSIVVTYSDNNGQERWEGVQGVP